MLTPRDRLILTFEETHPHGGTKEEAIRQTFGFSPARYYQIVDRLTGQQDAEAEFPMLVHQLRRQAIDKAAARRARAA